MKTKLTILAFTLALAGCATVADPYITPAQIYAEQGRDAALAWCDQRDVDLASMKGSAQLIGRLVDVPVKVVTAPVEAFVGPVIRGTTAVRDQQCALIRGQ